MDIIRIISCFIVYSFFGWVLESAYKSILEKKWINSGFLAGPLCPIYGCGATIMYLFLGKFQDNYVLLFALSFIVLSILEYLAGLGLEILFHTTYWDYSNKKFNIKGRVCLENSIYWGILGIVFIKIVHPGVEYMIDMIPYSALITITSIFMAWALLDTINTSIKIIRVNVKLKSLDEITDKIQKLIPRFNGVKTFNKNTVLRGIVKIKHKNRAALSELSQRRDELISKIERQTKRIRRAFPNMKSERISKYIKLPALRSQLVSRRKYRRYKKE